LHTSGAEDAISHRFYGGSIMAKIPHGIWKKINFQRGLEHVEYFGIGNDRITYQVERVTGNPLYKWVAKHPTNHSVFFFGKTLNEVKCKLDGIPKSTSN
jgi:hypothetical protein